MSKQLRLDVAQLTDVGRKRPHNEDNMAYVIPKDGQIMARKGALFIVADGMGGHAAGEVASEIAVDTVTNAYYQQDENDDISLALMNAIRRANALIHQRAAENMLRSGMGTTCVAAVMRGNMAYIANVGDSRAYLVRHGQARQISQDHSWVEEQVRAGLLTKEQARSHAQRNVITRSLGTQSEVEIDIFSEPLEEGDSFVLCTDGLSGAIDEEDLRVIVNQYQPQESVYHLVERANDNGGADNITAIVVQVQETGLEPPNARRPVYVGGREADEDTAVLGKVPTSTLGIPMHVDDSRIPSGVLRVSPSGPLLTKPGPSSVTQPLFEPVRKKRRRLLYPSLALFILLVVLLASGGIYYLLHQPIDADATLSEAATSINDATADVKNANFSQAVQNLARAQNDLHSLQNDSALTSDQHARYTTLQKSLVTTYKSVNTSYNHTALITMLPCVSTMQGEIGTGGLNTQAAALATIHNGNHTFSYAFAADGNIYQLDEKYNLIANSKYMFSNEQVVTLIGGGQYLFVLTQSTGATPATYQLYAFTAGDNGTLNAGTPVKIDIAQSGHLPRFLATTPTGSDVYVVLTSTQATRYQATVLDYNGTKLSDPPLQETISVSQPILSVAGWQGQGKQLFLLLSNSNVQSMAFTPDHSNPAPQPPQNVVVFSPPNPPNFTPLATNAQNYAWNTPIATLPTTASQSPLPLTVPGATAAGSAFLTSALVNTTMHLYIVDNTNNRIMDMVVGLMPSLSTATPSGTSITATSSGNVGGGAVPSVGNAVSLNLIQQYTSSTLLTAMKSVTVDVNAMHLSVLTQNGTGKAPEQVILDVTPGAPCTLAQ